MQLAVKRVVVTAHSTPCTRLLRTCVTSCDRLRALQLMAANGALDFIKLDIEGAEKELLDEEASRTVLCQARCLFMEVHERYAPGVGASLAAFLERGCAHMPVPLSLRFKQITYTREYTLWCRQDMFARVAKVTPGRAL